MILQAFHIILGQLQFESIDWMIQWYSAIEILDGIAFYDQTYRVVNGRYIWDANHPPIYFYSLAIWMTIVGTSHILARLYMYLWLVFTQVLMVEMIDPTEEKQVVIIVALICLNPFAILVSYLGLFDFVVITYILLSIYLVAENRPILASLTLVAAIFTKTFPIIFIAPFFFFYIKNRNYTSAISFAGVSIILSTILYYTFYSIFGHQFLRKLLLFQLNRNHANISIWYGIFGFQTPVYLVYLQISILFFTGLVLYFYPYTRHNYSLYSSSAILTIVFIILLRTSYPHYVIWYSILLVPIIFFHIKHKNHPIYLLLVGGVLLNFLGLSSCIYTCFDDPSSPQWLVQLQVLVHTTGHVIVLLTLLMREFVATTELNIWKPVN